MESSRENELSLASESFGPFRFIQPIIWLDCLHPVNAPGCRWIWAAYCREKPYSQPYRKIYNIKSDGLTFRLRFRRQCNE